MRQLTDARPRYTEEQKGTEYVRFDPPRRPEEYVGQPGPHNGLALEHHVLEAIADARVSGQFHPYVVQGKWIRRADRVEFLDVAVDRAWVTANTNWKLVNGRLRWTCPGCGQLSGTHAKGCDYR